MFDNFGILDNLSTFFILFLYAGILWYIYYIFVLLFICSTTYFLFCILPCMDLLCVLLYIYLVCGPACIHFVAMYW